MPRSRSKLSSEDSGDAMMKSELRTIFLERRQSLSHAEIKSSSEEISNLFFESISLDPIRFMHCFIAIERLREIDTSIILRRMWAERPQTQVLAPRIDFETGGLLSIATGPDTKFIRNRWGIIEPAGSEIIENSLIDLVLVPLLAFDQRGHRVGYGKGFYDRFLRTCRSDCLKVGLSIFPPVEEIADVDDHDTVLDSVITPGRIYRTPSAVA